MNWVQQDMFDSSLNGECEINKLRAIKNKEKAKKAAETRDRNKREKELNELRKFEKEHPESFLFDECKNNNGEV